MGHLLTVWVTHPRVRAWLCLHKDSGCHAGWEAECPPPAPHGWWEPHLGHRILGEMGRGPKPLAVR